MNFDVYYPFINKDGKVLPGIRPAHKSWEEIRNEWDNPKYRKILQDIWLHPENKAELKKQLPAICFTGTCNGTRSNANMTPTQLVMLDFDHVTALEDISQLFHSMREKQSNDWFEENVLLVHVTPSNTGLRVVCFANKDGGNNLASQMEYFYEKLKVEGSYEEDKAVKDFSRLSFYSNAQQILYENDLLFNHWTPEVILENSFKEEKKESVEKMNLEEVTFTDEEKEDFENFEFRGTSIKLIVEKYISVNGEPASGEKHGYYNEMVKNFRTICDNNKRLLLYILPRFGHTEEECWSQIKSICKVNTLSSIPKQFYFFLKDNGFYQPRENLSPQQGALKEYMFDEHEKEVSLPPYLPPVFRQYLKIAPPDFILPAMNALLPILGTLTSYVKAKYPYDDRYHTTSFFSIIYAPPGTGKSFVERFLGDLFADIRLRDAVQQMRENLYLQFLQKKGANDKSPNPPHTSLRLVPPKNSEAEFLQKQMDNHGYHMFTYAAEMDSWAKGVKAAGGNKDDMIRIAWDNGEYGQQFKSANTFKGVVNLYWNVLICGTLLQIENYFRNVENGLITRCSFTPIENQEFAAPPKWKNLSSKDMKVIKNFVARCDENSYEEPCTVDLENAALLSEEDFDKEIDWHFHFKEKQVVDMEWIMPTINEFHQEQIRKASLDVDRARDVFRRRVGVRGFRLALLCTCLWPKPTKRNLEDTCKFVKWWMEQDIESILKLWGNKYNEIADDKPDLRQRSVYSALDETFTKNDVYAVCMKQQIKTPIRNIIYNWKKNGYVTNVNKDMFKKLKK